MNIKKTGLALAIAAIVTLQGCSTMDYSYIDDQVEQNATYLQGMPVFPNTTPYTDVLKCLAEESATNVQFLNQYRYSIAVGKIDDMTGKLGFDGGGYKMTQGASLMMQTALFNTRAFRVVDRNQMDITNLERELASKQLIRDYDLFDNQRVRTLTAGEIIGSEYRVVGAITELNWNVDSSGTELGVAGVGTKARRYVADVGLDLFLVDTKSTQIIDVVSVKKQVAGYEVRSGIFRFFDSLLYDINVGEKKQEPLQLAVRAAIEYGAYQFTTKLYGIPSQKCSDMLESIDKL